MAHYKIILAYDGTEFLGFQRQIEGRTVQDTLESALREIGWGGSSIIGAGRTDAGVHAAGQVVGIEFDWSHSAENLRDALNANLPQDVAACSVEEIDEGFHARFSATARRYHYRLFFDEIRNPLKERYAWRVWPPLSMELVETAAALLIGKHDFSAFGTPPIPGGSTIREIMSTSWIVKQDYVVFEILGNSFLYHMVRRLVNFQVEIGKERRSPSEVDMLLKQASGPIVQGLAPARGLCLEEVRYPT
jgi:tRNA pseudouridine38-40 synthase